MLGNFITEKKSKNIKFNTFQFKFHTIFTKKSIFPSNFEAKEIQAE